MESIESLLRSTVPVHPPYEPNAYLLNGQPLGIWSIRDSVPVVIETNYIAKGQAFTDKSLYEFEFVEVLSPRGKPDKFDYPQIPQFTGLLFSRRLSPSTNPVPLLDALMRAKKFAWH